MEVFWVVRIVVVSIWVIYLGLTVHFWRRWAEDSYQILREMGPGMTPAMRKLVMPLPVKPTLLSAATLLMTLALIGSFIFPVPVSWAI